MWNVYGLCDPGERRHLRRAHVFSIIHQTIRDKYGRHIGKLKINIRSKTYEAPRENRNSASQWPRIYFSDVMVTRFFPQIVEIIIKNKYYLFPIKLRWHRCNADNSFFGANLRFPLGLRISEAHVRGLVFWVWVCVTIVKDVYMCRFFSLFISLDPIYHATTLILCKRPKRWTVQKSIKKKKRKKTTSPSTSPWEKCESIFVIE